MSKWIEVQECLSVFNKGERAMLWTMMAEEFTPSHLIDKETIIKMTDAQVKINLNDLLVDISSLQEKVDMLQGEYTLRELKRIASKQPIDSKESKYMHSYIKKLEEQ